MGEHPTNGRDIQAGQLRARYPGWHIWWVASAVTRTATWSAQPARYPLVGASPAELAALIEADETRGEEP